MNEESVRIRPLSDRVVIQPDEPAAITPGGIVLPDSAKERPQRGTVIAAGPGRVCDAGLLIPMQVSIGEKVLYSRYAGTEAQAGGTDYVILRENDILAILD